MSPHDTERDGYDTSFDPRAESATETVAKAMMDLTGRGPEAVPPVAAFVDADALNELFDPDRVRNSETLIELRFRYDGRVVELSTEGEIAVLPESGDPGDRSDSSGPDQ